MTRAAHPTRSPDQAWGETQRTQSLRECIALMIAHENELSKIDQVKLAESRRCDPILVPIIWEEELTKASLRARNNYDMGEGK